MNVLLAEDDTVARMMLSAVLKGLGYDVTEAEHGGEALANLQLGYFPIVISDWSMPEVDGPELCRRMRARATDRYSYFLLITATGGKQRYLEGMEAGADDFITKPNRRGRAARPAQSRRANPRPAATRATARGVASHVCLLQTHSRCVGELGIDRALCRRPISGAVQSRLLSGLLRKTRAASDRGTLT